MYKDLVLSGKHFSMFQQAPNLLLHTAQSPNYGQDIVISPHVDVLWDCDCYVVLGSPLATPFPPY